jgi:hypothetical protein
MKKIEIYDPAMCCSTGVCGTNVDAKLVQFTSDLAWLKEEGVEVQRFNLGQQPKAFAENILVRDSLAKDGEKCLPLILVDGMVVSRGLYLNREQLADLADVCMGSGCCSEEDESDSDCCADKPGGTSCC